ncbi:MAG: ABC transporter substrate-binding protein [Treponema sp.]|jgi:peptide/nickel transport system substrate-binding protein|nr:ABC transporter substrate-binding protein [Treponema sp.]
MKQVGIFFLLMIFALSSCTKHEELSLEELEAISAEGLQELLAKTMTKPWRGEEFVPGKLGGTWNSSMIKDPKSFNHLIAERDAETAGILRMMTDYLVKYDVVRREWKASCAFPQIIVNADTLDVIYTLRDNLYWSYYNSDKKIPVTSDDVIFWYNEIEGDEKFQSSAYNGQFLTMEDGSEARITIHRINDKSFRFHFPRIVADPLLTTNRDFGPRHVYEPAKKANGIQGVRDLFSVASDPKLIPSMGEWFLVEYVQSQRLVFKRNPDYWDRDSTGLSIPYLEENIVQILPDQNTQYLVFKEGRLETYSSRPEDLNELVNKQNAPYTVFNAEGNLGPGMWGFNQNPQNSNEPYYDWFTKKEFRQAMSCLLNRQRLNAQVYRGLAEPKLDFFPPPNPFYNPDIKLEYLYDPAKALELLQSVGFIRDKRGTLYDEKNRRVEFDLSFTADNNVTSDIASVIVDELGKIGIKVNIRATDFQKLVEQLTSTYDWQTIMIGLGTNFFPTQGSNVWPSTGNLHFWHPLQETPFTEWEARIDFLYNEGSYTIDKEKAFAIWDEYQRILLEQCPVIYLMRMRGFWAIQNRWDFANVYFDNLNGAETQHIFLSKSN